MGDFTIDVDGFDRLINVLNQLPEKTSNQVKRQLQASADRVLAQSQKEVAVDKGDLKSTGRVEPYTDGDYSSHQTVAFDVAYGGINGTVTGKPVDYAGFVHDGTTKQAPQPYLAPPFEEESQKLVGKLGDIIRGS